MKKNREAYASFGLWEKVHPHNKILKRLKEDPDIRAAIDKWDLYYYAEQNKEEKQKALAELFIIIDEKSNEYELTDKGIHVWQEMHVAVDRAMTLSCWISAMTI